MGKEPAKAAIKAAVAARLQSLPDGTLRLDAPALQEWLWQRALEVVADDVSPGNRSAARGMVDQVAGMSATEVARLQAVHAPEHWSSRPDYPTARSIASTGAFVSAASQALAEMGALAARAEDEYHAIVADLPQVISEAWDAAGAAANLPPAEERIVESRFYVYTHVNDLGEESAPSPVTPMLELDQRDTVNLSAAPPPPGRHITAYRVYRSTVGTVGAAFQFIAEGPAPSPVWTDNVPLSAAGEVLPTTTWAEPPEGLRGICEMHSGIITGFFDNTTAFCEPFIAYAWPVEYQLSCAHPITAQAAFGQTLVRLHRGGVDYIAGADPASMSVSKDVSLQVCASPRSVCPVEGGVVFASEDGLCLASSGGVQVLTQGRILRDDWQGYQPGSMFCHHSEGTVYLWGAGVPGVFALHLPSGRISTVDFDAGGMSAVYETGKALYGASGNSIYRLFAGPAAREAAWRSKVMVLPQHAGFAWLAVESNFENGPVQVKWYGDGVLRHTASVSSRAPVRLPSGRYLEHEVEVTSRSAWNALTLASSGDELRAV